MLHFWYSERCTRPIKLLICIITVAVTLYFSEMTKLSTSLTLLSLLLGMVIHGLYSLLMKLPQPNSAWSQSFKILPDLTLLMGWIVIKTVKSFLTKQRNFIMKVNIPKVFVFLKKQLS